MISLIKLEYSSLNLNQHAAHPLYLELNCFLLDPVTDIFGTEANEVSRRRRYGGAT